MSNCMQPLQKNANSATLVAKSAILVTYCAHCRFANPGGGGGLKRDNKFYEENWRSPNIKFPLLFL